MTLFLLLLLLLSVAEETFGIFCIYSEKSFELSLDNFNYDEFKMEINDFPVYDYKDNNIDKCRVEIYIDYKSRLAAVSFGDSFPWSQLNHGEGRLDFLIMFHENNAETEFYNVLEYACYDQDQCNKLFALNHIQWLRQINYTLFEFHLRSLLFSNVNQPGEFCYQNYSLLYIAVLYIRSEPLLISKTASLRASSDY